MKSKLICDKKKTMKKLILFALILTSCSKLEFQYDSNINYSIYKKAYIVEIYNNLYSISFDEEAMMNYFCDILKTKSGFNTITHYYNNPELADSLLPSEYLSLKLYIKKVDSKYKENVNDNSGDVDYYYEAEVTVACETYCRDSLLFTIDKEGKYSDEFEEDAIGNYVEVKETALMNALKELAIYFTKSYKI